MSLGFCTRTGSGARKRPYSKRGQSKADSDDPGSEDKDE